jgi:hypothetical protein
VSVRGRRSDPEHLRRCWRCRQRRGNRATRRGNRLTISAVEAEILDAALARMNAVAVLQEKAREHVMGPVAWPYRMEACRR